ncbi:MAG: 50S ribosomal protein L11 methyltransferase [Clostridia bacterium]
MKYYEVTIKTTHDCADLIADALFSVGCSGVSIKDKADILEIYKSSVIWDYIDESLLNKSDETVFVSAIIGEENKEETLKTIRLEMEELERNCYFETGSLEVKVDEINDEDWRNEWKKYYKPIVTSSVTVVPTWIKYEPQTGEKVLWINPGMAFGTGDHETTNMCLSLLGEIDVKDKSIIDVGTGSGILGIASIISGAKSAYMCDIDGVAIENARENVNLNHVGDSVIVEVSDLLSKNNLKGDVIFANITADILIKLSNNVVNFLNPNGKIILSGIIHSRLNDVIAAYLSSGLQLVKQKVLGEWNALMFNKAEN